MISQSKSRSRSVITAEYISQLYGLKSDFHLSEFVDEFVDEFASEFPLKRIYQRIRRRISLGTNIYTTQR